MYVTFIRKFSRYAAIPAMNDIFDNLSRNDFINYIFIKRC